MKNKPFLCKIGLHKWKDTIADGTHQKGAREKILCYDIMHRGCSECEATRDLWIPGVSKWRFI